MNEKKLVKTFSYTSLKKQSKVALVSHSKVLLLKKKNGLGKKVHETIKHFKLMTNFHFMNLSSLDSYSFSYHQTEHK